jgi:hypothetical protein
MALGDVLGMFWGCFGGVFLFQKKKKRVLIQISFWEIIFECLNCFGVNWSQYRVYLIKVE